MQWIYRKFWKPVRRIEFAKKLVIFEFKANLQISDQNGKQKQNKNSKIFHFFSSCGTNSDFSWKREKKQKKPKNPPNFEEKDF